MTKSMTAFARQDAEYAWGSISWEIRSVNHRYLEPHLRLPDNLRDIEPVLREKLRKSLNRGKVECTLRFFPEASLQQLVINEEYARQVVAAAEQVQRLIAGNAPLDALEVLRWPGVLQDVKLDMEAVKTAAVVLFDKALTDLTNGRRREGQELAQLIEQRLVAISDIVDLVRAQMPTILSNQRDTLAQRIAELKVDLDEARLEQEVVLLAQKADVDEEMDRLNTHVQEVRRILQQNGPVGRRLDFLMQELNREANTLSSKSIVSGTTQSAVELKVLIEQMREQIQNIE
ncbi:YicC/YloC family endoribonuclease [Neptuniibacter sp. CAU 1671]|uniref:YicC/YloC family endoribonuclease n=1 Tax=Neptuniibacter sp. CAU 1671 TaxID=3032593 RepID=UPI0023D9D0B0|nr:YicC/YloC family endoribonuclease [Neptuniibacter sp. CAU 1671]MDF2182569.1 YicC family protein [Neptuniibacter sp. CAU 1671]